MMPQSYKEPAAHQNLFNEWPILLCECAVFSKLAHIYDNALSPTIDPMRVVRKNNLQNVAGSWKTKMPTRTVPTAPIPVHTG